MTKIEYLWNVQDRIYRNIQFADQKATALLALNIASSAAWISGVFFKENNPIFLVSPAILLVAIFALGLVLFPREKSLSKSIDGGETILPSKIYANFNSNGNYISAVSELYTGESNEKLENEITAVIKWASLTNHYKYTWFKVGLVISIIGLLSMVLVLETNA